MKKNSLWLEGVTGKIESALKKDLECDILIVGAGMTGLSTAYHLKDQKLNIVVVDENKIGHGVSARTTGKLTYLQETIYRDLKKSFSAEVSKQYLESQKEAIQIVKSIIEKYQIACDFERVSSYIFSTHSSQNKKIEEEKQLLKEFGIDVKEKKKYQIEVEDTYVFHPIKYMMTLKELCQKDGVQFYEHTSIQFLKKDGEKYICGNEKIKIYAKKVVFACHYPYFLFPFLMPLKCTIEKSYLSASPILKREKVSMISAGKPVVSVRYHFDGRQNYMIYLSDSHSLYKDYNEQKHFNHLKEEVSKLDIKPEFLWSNHDIITFDKLPFVGRLQKENNDLFLATGYNTWGMTNGNLAGKILSDLILNVHNSYENLFSPLRKLKITKLPEAIYGNSKSMIESKLWKNKKWYPENVFFETRNGDKIAIYVDHDGKEHIVYSTCPHLKCSLLFNLTEKTWDCPCHGSRFDLNGNVIIGPANQNIKYQK